MYALRRTYVCADRKPRGGKRYYSTMKLKSALHRALGCIPELHEEHKANSGERCVPFGKYCERVWCVPYNTAAVCCSTPVEHMSIMDREIRL